MDRRHPNVANLEEVAPQEQRRGKIGHRVRRLGTPAGGRALGCSHYEVSPGLTAFPRHFHSLMEEALYILEGTGTLRIGEAEVAVRAGDYIAFPAGPDTVHGLTNFRDRATALPRDVEPRPPTSITSRTSRWPGSDASPPYKGDAEDAA